MTLKSLALPAFLFAALATPAFSETIAVDPAIKEYEQVSGVSGNLNAIGSDTLNNLMSFWAEAFKTKYPNVKIQIEGKGSATAPVALVEGTAQLGPMSRAMKSAEIDGFEKKYGYKPTEIKVSIDALAVFAHKDNPIKGLTKQQIDSVFSKTRKLGGPEIVKWGQLGLTGEWAEKPISLYGRNSASGTYAFFKDEVLGKGDFKDTVKEQPGSSAVVQGIANDLGALGYSGIGYATPGVKALALGESADSEFDPTLENCLSGDYPLARFLYVYINKKPGQPVDLLTREFLKFALSKSGQEIVVKDHYYPLPADVVAEALKALE